MQEPTASGSHAGVSGTLPDHLHDMGQHTATASCIASEQQPPRRGQHSIIIHAWRLNAPSSVRQRSASPGGANAANPDACSSSINSQSSPPPACTSSANAATALARPTRPPLWARNGMPMRSPNELEPHPLGAALCQCSPIELVVEEHRLGACGWPPSRVRRRHQAGQDLTQERRLAGLDGAHWHEQAVGIRAWRGVDELNKSLVLQRSQKDGMLVASTRDAGLQPQLATEVHGCKRQWWREIRQTRRYFTPACMADEAHKHAGLVQRTWRRTGCDC